MAALKGGIGVGAIVSSRKTVSVVRGPPAAARRLAPGPTVASPIARRCPHAARRAVAAVLGRRKPSIGSKCPGPMARAVKAEARPPAADEARQPAEPTRPRARGARQYESHQEARAARASYAVAGLLAELPDTAADRLLGKRAARQVPDARRRRELAVVLLRRKAGPKGDQARKALRAWRLLQAAAAARALPAQGLPASAALVADVVRTELQRAQREAKGSQGGCTVGGTIRDGFVWLQTVAKLPIEADSSLVEAAAAAEQGAAPNPTRHAGSLSIAVQCAFEAVAAEGKWSVRRTLARSFLCSVFAHHIRCVDALNCELFADERGPRLVIRGRTRVRSKNSPLI